MLGQIIVLASGSVPHGYHLADGTWLNKSEYPDLFNEIGTLYNKNVEKPGMFRLPDCRGRVVVGMGTGAEPALYQRKIGTIGGVEHVVLTEEQMPEHSHSYTRLGVSEATPNPIEGWVRGGLYQKVDRCSTVPAGGNQPHENMQPFVTMNVLIYIGENTPLK